jgi:hypothetical protein
MKAPAAQFENKNLDAAKSELAAEFRQEVDILDLIVQDFVALMEQECEEKGQQEM